MPRFSFVRILSVLSAFDVEYILKDVCQFSFLEGSIRVELSSLAEGQKFPYVLALKNVLSESCQVVAVRSEAGCIEVFSDFVEFICPEIIFELFTCCFREEMPPVNGYFVGADVYCGVFDLFCREITSYRFLYILFIVCLGPLAFFSRMQFPLSCLCRFVEGLAVLFVPFVIL